MNKKYSTLKDGLQALASKAITKSAMSEWGGWPPTCIGIIHQPERPKCLEYNPEKKKI